MYNDKLKKFYRTIRFEVKYFWRNFQLRRKIEYFYERKRNNFCKKKYNFIDAQDFIRLSGSGQKKENFDEYGIDLFEFEDVWISGLEEGTFIHKLYKGKKYTFKESAGIKVRLVDMRFTMPANLKKNVVEEDEICQASFLKGDNYWHFTCDILPRIMMMEKSGYKGKYIVNSSKCVREFLELLSIPEERLIFSERGKVIHAKKVYMFNEIYGINLSQDIISDLRKFIMERVEAKNGSLIDETYPKKIYISRIGRRKILNEGDIINYLQKFDFKTITPENYSVYEQMKFFANADVIVQPHGANCTNMLYSKPGTIFVECFGHQWINPCMISTIILLQLDYRMVCETLGDNDKNLRQFADYLVNTKLFQCIMKNVMETYRKKLNPVI